MGAETGLVSRGPHAGSKGIEFTLKGQKDCLRVLLETGVDPDYRNREKYTALHIAARVPNRTDCAELLISSAADVDAKGPRGETPLLRSVNHGNIAMVGLLLGHRASPHITDNSGLTPLCYVRPDGDLPTIKLLCANGADVNFLNGQDTTPLISAATSGNLDLVKFLIDNGAKVDKNNRDGHTALFRAAKRGHVKVFRALLDRGADIHFKNWKGHDILYACTTGGRGNKEIEKLCLDARKKELKSRELDEVVEIDRAIGKFNHPPSLFPVSLSGEDGQTSYW